MAKAMVAPAPMVSRPYLWQSSFPLQMAARSLTPQSEPRAARVSYSGPPYRASTLYGVSSSTSFLHATAQA